MVLRTMRITRTTKVVTRSRWAVLVEVRLFILAENGRARGIPSCFPAGTMVAVDGEGVSGAEGYSRPCVAEAGRFI